mmetsp:Transcript_22726/g.36226  ORF Transcript_22726/g.36226 Transcript_22726/m.36226 type:complete len:95 (+) Transcript_22726:5203-5487(+)
MLRVLCKDFDMRGKWSVGEDGSSENMLRRSANKGEFLRSTARNEEVDGGTIERGLLNSAPFSERYFLPRFGRIVGDRDSSFLGFSSVGQLDQLG